MSRAIESWVAKHDDQAIPDKVKRRVLDRQRNADGIPICPDCTNQIRPSQAIEYDHALPLIDGGKHSEENLRAIHQKPCHAIKTAREAHNRAEERAQMMGVYGLKKSKTPFPKRKPYQPNVRQLYGDIEEGNEAS